MGFSCFLHCIPLGLWACMRVWGAPGSTSFSGSYSRLGWYNFHIIKSYFRRKTLLKTLPVTAATFFRFVTKLKSPASTGWFIRESWKSIMEHLDWWNMALRNRLHKHILCISSNVPTLWSRSFRHWHWGRSCWAYHWRSRIKKCLCGLMIKNTVKASV